MGASPTRQPLQPEATGAARACVARELAALVAEGAVTAVLVTHDVGEAIRPADRIFVLPPRPVQVIGRFGSRAGGRR